MKKVTTFTTSLTTAKRNEQRAKWAERALLAFAEAADVSLEYAVGDLIGDLMQNGMFENVLLTVQKG